MASANVLAEDSFLTHLECVRVELRERVSRAHEVLQERETALLSELQQLENRYRGVVKEIQELSRWKKQALIIFQKNNYQNLYIQIYQMDARMRELQTILETARDKIIRMELEWDGNIEGILSRTGSIRMRRVSDYKEKGNNVTVAAYYSKKRRKATSESSPTYGKNKRFTTASSHEYETRSTSQNIPSYTGSSSNYCHHTPTLSFTPSAPRKIKEHTNRQTHISPTHTNKTSSNSPNNITTKSNQLPKHNTLTTPIRGLKNLGNTCYMNSVLQCLSHTLPLRQFYVSDEYKQFLNYRGVLSNAFKRVMVELWDTTSGDSVVTYELKRQLGKVAPRFIGYSQQDAHEFMRFFLNKLHEEINRASVEGRKSPADNETLEEACARYLTWEDSRISELFGGMLRSDVCCSVCCNQSTVYIPFMDIALPIPERKQRSYHIYSKSSDPTVHLSDCINMLTTEETLDKKERPYCNKCKKTKKSTKQLSIAKPPRFLVIQLKRFSSYPKRTKRSTPVTFDETWKLIDSANETHTYSLYGIVSHSGSISGGHYIAYCKYRDKWRCFNDKIADIVSLQHIKEQEAYVLFYEKEVIL